MKHTYQPTNHGCRASNLRVHYRCNRTVSTGTAALHISARGWFGRSALDALCFSWLGMPCIRPRSARVHNSSAASRETQRPEVWQLVGQHRGIEGRWSQDTAAHSSQCRDVRCRHSAGHAHAAEGHGNHTHTSNHTDVHDNSNGCGHCHHEQPTTAAEKFVARALQVSGLQKLSDKLEHNVLFTAVSIACWCIALAASTFHEHGYLSASVSSICNRLALSITYFLSGIPQCVEVMQIAAQGKLDTHVLMFLAILGTLYMNMAQEGALLLLLFRVSHLLEERFSATAAGSLERLFAAIPSTATVVQLDGGNKPIMSSAHEMHADDVQLGQHVLVKPGQQVPLDGCVEWGVSNVSMAHISGESLPVRVAPGSDLPAGSTCLDGTIVVKATAIAQNSTPARIARMTQQAQADKPQVQRWLDNVAGAWAVAVIVATLGTLAVLLMMGMPLLEHKGALYRAMGVLTAGSPCALVLVPLAYVCAVASVTARGVLVKGSGVLDDLARCHHVALDKTGTITTGLLGLLGSSVIRVRGDAAKPLISVGQQLPAAGLADKAGNGSSNGAQRELERMDSGDSREGDASVHIQAIGEHSSYPATAFNYAVALSKLSTHPVNKAMVAAGGARADMVQVQQFKLEPGAGVEGLCQVEGAAPCFVRFGSLEYVTELATSSGQSAADLAAAVSAHNQLSSKGVAFLAMQEQAGGNSNSTWGPGSDGQTPGDHPEAGALDKGTVRVATAHREARLVMFTFEDGLQPGVADAVQQLGSGSWRSQVPAAEAAKRVVMLTGDNPAVAASVASSVGIQDFKAALKPQNKRDFVVSLRNGGSSSKRGVVMVGDGINDAPALKAADVGVALAVTHSDAVAAAADIIVLNNQGVAALPWLFKLADRTQLIVKQNVALALISMALAVFPTVAGVFPLWLALTLHEGSTLLVALNSLRLLGGGEQSPLAVLALLLKEPMGSSVHSHGHDHGHSHGGHQHGHEHGHSHSH